MENKTVKGFDKMYAAFEEWKKTSEAFACVQASDFAEVWMTAYRAGEKAEREACAMLCEKMEADAHNKGDGWQDIGNMAGECSDAIRSRSNT